MANPSKTPALPQEGTTVFSPREQMEQYANQYEVQKLLQELLADVFREAPEDYVSYMINWLKKEQKKLAGEAANRKLGRDLDSVKDKYST